MRGPAIPSVDQLLVLAPLPTTWPLKRYHGQRVAQQGFEPRLAFEEIAPAPTPKLGRNSPFDFWARREQT